ncbi:unnamed protein product [Durusdinium trenchii]|uniref:PDZ domain-containing protein n=1 Tax=Durusdinium trenchii TaxID=1381693 RepID=A0ABP0JCC3_9DINO
MSFYHWLAATCHISFIPLRQSMDPVCLGRVLDQATFIRSPTEFTIILDRRNNEGLGVDAAPEKVGTLEIKSVTPGGLVDRWNQAQQPGSREIVRPGMRVVEVNGRFNSAVGLIAACRETEVLHVAIEP